MKRYTLAGMLIVAVLFVAGWTYQEAKRPAWEFKVISISRRIPQPEIAPEIVQAGAEGWEIVTVTQYKSVSVDTAGTAPPGTSFIFKRQK